MDIHQYSDLILETFDCYLKVTNKLCLHVHDQLKNYPVWIDDAKGNFSNDRDKIIFAIKYAGITSHLSPQEVYSCPGAVGCSAETFLLIDKVNSSKDNFKFAVQTYLRAAHGNPTKPAREILARAGHGGVKLLQVYRHIPYIEYHPRRIAWSKSKKSSHVIVTTNKAKELLLNLGNGEHIDVQLTKLGILSESDKLVIYRPLKDSWGINVSSFKDAEGLSKAERIREESLPLFYLHDKKLPLPMVCFSKKINRSVGHRSDKILEEVPFLKSIHAYRYSKNN